MGNVFFHIDLDAFFASVEILDHPEYKGKPLIIGTPGPRHVASTCSYEARQYGIHSAMSMSEALRLCPSAICVNGHYERYSQKSKEVMSIIKDFAPGFLQVSIDEAFLDLTGMERIYPLPGKAAKLLKKKIFDKTRLTVSIGVSTSRFISKMASDYHKPDGLTIVPPGMEEQFVDKVGLKKLWGIGKSSYDHLVASGLNTTQVIRKQSLEALQSRLGDSSALYLYNAVRGIDPGIFQGEVKSHSISTESTYSPDIFDINVLQEYLLQMSLDLAFRAFEEKSVAKTVTLKLRYGDFTTTTIQETPNYGIYSSDDIFQIAKKLLSKKYKGGGIRLLGLALGNLYHGEEIEQTELFAEVSEKKRKLEKVVYNLNKKGGIVTKATLLNKGKNKDEDSK